ncbi:MAG: flagellar hook-associated protein 3, partial [Rhodocyclaceae bacterium]|nr:flagellar hook-associated protein 3 [Rhodocyclaceae bacterium]
MKEIIVRVSSAQIFDSGTRGMGRNQYDLYKLQNQLSSGRKNLTPADDPIATAQSLVLTQSKDVSAQYLKNQDAAKGRLSLVDSQLNAMSELMLNVRDKVVQAGNTTLTEADRSF